MGNAFAHFEMTSEMWVKAGIMAHTLSSGTTVNTYDADPQPAAGIDSWDDGNIIPRKLLIIANVGNVSGSGALAITLRDCATALTTANGDANSGLAASCSNITAAGIYIAEFHLHHVFSGADDDDSYIKRYHSIRAVATSCDFTFSVDCVYGMIDRNWPTQDATSLTVTYNDPS